MDHEAKQLIVAILQALRHLDASIREAAQLPPRNSAGVKPAEPAGTHPAPRAIPQPAQSGGVSMHLHQPGAGPGGSVAEVSFDIHPPAAGQAPGVDPAFDVEHVS